MISKLNLLIKTKEEFATKNTEIDNPDSKMKRNLTNLNNTIINKEKNLLKESGINNNKNISMEQKDVNIDDFKDINDENIKNKNEKEIQLIEPKDKFNERLNNLKINNNNKNIIETEQNIKNKMK